MTDQRGDGALALALERLTRISIDQAQSPYDRFDWPTSLSEDEWWMSQDLLSVHGTKLAEGFDELQLKRLGKWESIHFYSLNIHGIRELLGVVMNRIHTAGFEASSFHRFIAEENEHMWFSRSSANATARISIRTNP